MAVFYNKATLSYNDKVTDSNIVTGEIVEVLSVTKTALSDSYSDSSRITYVVNIVNSGVTSFTGLTASDNMGEYSSEAGSLIPLDYVDGSLRAFVNGVPASFTVTSGEYLNVTGINVPANGNVTLVYEAETNRFAPPESGSSIENTVTVSGGELANPITATAVVGVSDAPLLTISKCLCPSEVTENGQINYTFVIQNTGNTAADASDNAIVTDNFDPILKNISVTFNNTTWSSPTNYGYNTATGAFATVPGMITVPAATYEQDPATGEWNVKPGISILTVSGSI